LALGYNAEAEANSKLAIRNAEELLQELKATSAPSESQPDDLRDSINRASRVLSDRKGNLAIIYLQQDRFKDAFELIEKLLLEDKESLYIRGLVVKQGTLGHYYLKQGEVGSAERVFYDALQFIQRRDENMFSREWNSEVRETLIFPLVYPLQLVK
jgi:Tfp pilus assembly protein PilF